MKINKRNGVINVIISDYIEAKYTDASASTLIFTHKTWDYIHKEHEKLYPEKKIIGWQHTHPNYDMFIQENFFNLPFQIAYVIDPIQNIRGFFQWKGGKIEKLKGYYIYDDLGKNIKVEQTKVKKKEEEETKKIKKMYVVIALLCIAITIITIIAMSLKNKYNEQLLKQETIIVEMNNQADAINKLQKQLINGILDSTGKTTAKDLIGMIQKNEINIENKEEILNQLQEFINRENGRFIEFKLYTVVKGDNLYKICKKIILIIIHISI